MSSLSNLKTETSIQTFSNESLLEMKKIIKIRKSLLNLEKEEVDSFTPLKVKIYKDKNENQENENKIKIPLTFKFYFEDYKKFSRFINQIESGFDTKLSGTDSDQVEQIDSSDLANSE